MICTPRGGTRPACAVARGGFTLTELVLVIAVLGGLAVVAGPRFFGTREFDERLFFDETWAALRYAHKLAVATGCETQVSIVANGYSLAQRSGCDAGLFDRPVVHPGTTDPAYTGTAPPGVTLSSDVSPFRFDALGRARDGGGSVTDVSLTVGARTLVVAGETGFVGVP